MDGWQLTGQKKEGRLSTLEYHCSHQFFNTEDAHHALHVIGKHMKVLSSSSIPCLNAGMDIPTAPSYRGYRFPAEIISHCVWLYFHFCLSFRDVQEMMLERGVEVSHEAIRLWTLKFGVEYARRLRRR